MVITEPLYLKGAALGTTLAIVEGDAFYATYFMLCDLQQRGVDAVFE